MPPKIAIAIPCYKVKKHILDVISGIPSWVDYIFAIDDACPQESGKFIAENCTDPRVQVLYHAKNKGVGGATITGYRAALESGCAIVIKMDGDDQMDPTYLSRLINPILIGRADYTKGNRFYDLASLRQMPLIRRIGNIGLTLLTKVSSGFWHVSDPTNGYTAVHTSVLRVLNLDRLAERYFFETSMLIQLNIVRTVAYDVPIPARYGSETSSLSVSRAFFGFPAKLLSGLMQRLFWRYFIYDINAGTFLLGFGGLLFLSGSAFGAYHWVIGGLHQSFTSPGTVALALLPVLLGAQMLMQSVLLDIMDKPSMPLHLLLDDRPKLRTEAP